MLLRRSENMFKSFKNSRSQLAYFPGVKLRSSQVQKAKMILKTPREQLEPVPVARPTAAPFIHNRSARTMTFIPRLRIATISSVVVLSLVWLAVVIHMTVVDGENGPTGALAGVMGIATVALTLTTGLTMAALGYRRPGLWRSMIVAEVCWLSVVWIMWALTAIFGVLPDTVPFDGQIDQGSEIGPIIAFPFVNWILLMIYTIVLPFYKSRLAPSAAKFNSEEAQIDCRSTRATIRTSGEETLIGHASVITIEKSLDKEKL
ncbi:hypothetical protein B0H19DRAFT_1141575 [Mycena capillaripes]|nr:hypothetical protein B0H19DRAFT_1141575 [Mycena capillaripes]